jgi:hypothetical protein
LKANISAETTRTNSAAPDASGTVQNGVQPLGYASGFFDITQKGTINAIQEVSKEKRHAFYSVRPAGVGNGCLPHLSASQANEIFLLVFSRQRQSSTRTLSQLRKQGVQGEREIWSISIMLSENLRGAARGLCLMFLRTSGQPVRRSLSFDEAVQGPAVCKVQ